MLRTINLEDGLPTVEEARKRLHYEIITARRQKIKVLKIIHGYGSSGKGGKLRVHTRKELESLKKRGFVKFYIVGEKLSIFDADTRKAIEICREFRQDSDIERYNNGVTVAIL